MTSASRTAAGMLPFGKPVPVLWAKNERSHLPMTQAETSHPIIENFHAAATRRGESVFASADRHSRRVRILKFAIPGVALLSAGIFGGATFFRNELPVALSSDGVSLSDGRIVMANPKLDGMTGDKRSYKMQAERAYQEIKKNGLVELENISAELPFGVDTVAQLKAGRGFFDNGNSLLDLGDGIELTTSDGMQAKLRSARVDIGKNGLSTSDPVDITTDGAHITADSMQVSDGGKRLVFEKRVRLVIDPKKMKTADGALAAQQAE